MLLLLSTTRAWIIVDWEDKTISTLTMLVNKVKNECLHHDTTLNMIFSVTDSNRLAQILIISRGRVSPTLNVNPTFFGDSL